MTKMIKLSLVAAVAVAGFTTSAAAADLKDTTFSGKAEFEYDYTKNNTAATTTNGYDIDLDIAAKTKLSDTWTSVVVIQADTTDDIQNDDTAGVGGGIAAVDTAAIESGLSNANVNVAATFFQYADGTNTAKIGRMGVGTPFFDDERGDGFVALTTVNGYTLAGAHYDNVNMTLVSSDHAVNAAAIIGTIGSVNASLWYASISQTFDAYSVNLTTKLDTISLDLTHTALDLDGATTDNSLTKIIASVPVGPVTLKVGYSMTDKEGGLVALNDDASAAFTLDNLSLNNQADASAFLVGISGKLGNVSASLCHLNGDIAGADIDETLVKASYPLAKALTATAKYSDYTNGALDAASASIALEYKF